MGGWKYAFPLDREGGGECAGVGSRDAQAIFTRDHSRLCDWGEKDGGGVGAGAKIQASKAFAANGIRVKRLNRGRPAYGCDSVALNTRSASNSLRMSGPGLLTEEEKGDSELLRHVFLVLDRCNVSSRSGASRRPARGTLFWPIGSSPNFSHRPGMAERPFLTQSTTGWALAEGIRGVFRGASWLRLLEGGGRAASVQRGLIFGPRLVGRKGQGRPWGGVPDSQPRIPQRRGQGATRPDCRQLGGAPLACRALRKPLPYPTLILSCSACCQIGSGRGTGVGTGTLLLSMSRCCAVAALQVARRESCGHPKNLVVRHLPARCFLSPGVNLQPWQRRDGTGGGGGGSWRAGPSKQLSRLPVLWRGVCHFALERTCLHAPGGTHLDAICGRRHVIAGSGGGGGGGGGVGGGDGATLNVCGRLGRR